MGLVQSIAALSSRFGRRSSPSPSSDPRHILGREGERRAVPFLRRERYKILYRNFRAKRGGEVDIVCRDKTCDTLVFVEVKTRRSADFGTPAEAVDPAKQELIARGALAWLQMLDNPEVIYRFDIVEVFAEGREMRFNLIKNAFQLPKRYF